MFSWIKCRVYSDKVFLCINYWVVAPQSTKKVSWSSWRYKTSSSLILKAYVWLLSVSSTFLSCSRFCFLHVLSVWLGDLQKLHHFFSFCGLRQPAALCPAMPQLKPVELSASLGFYIHDRVIVVLVWFLQTGFFCFIKVT